jgi:hypothetical protein
MNKNILLAFLALLIIAIMGYGFISGAPEGTTVEERMADVEYVDEEISVAPDTGITADDILNDPDGYDGLTVTIRAEVEQWLTPNAFVLDAPGIAGDNLLVITTNPNYIFEDSEIFGDAIWEVRGTVGHFEVVAAQDTYDLDFEADIFTVYEGAPYIIADSVELYED